MNAAELSAMLENLTVKAELKKTELSMSDEQIEEYKALRTSLNQGIALTVSTRQAATSATTALRQKVKLINTKLGLLNKQLKGNENVTSDLIESIGLESDDNVSSAIVPVAPTDLVVEGRSNGINYVKWKSGGNKPRTNYVLEAKIGDATEYVFVTVTAKTRYEHKNQTPGVRVLYRVKAVHNDLESACSNEAVIYN